MTDESDGTDIDVDALRRLRPDRLQPDDPPDPQVLAGQRDRLLAAIAPAATVDPRRLPPVLYPRLAYEDERAALGYLTRVFGFRERREARQEHAQGMLAWLELGDGVVMIGRAGDDLHDLHSPRAAGRTTAMVNVYVEDVDAHHRRAVAEGAVVVAELEDMFWGDRRYEALDAEGHRWHFGERLADAQRRTAGAAGSGQDAAALPPGIPRILPHVVYDDVGAAVRFLTEAFGFAERERYRHTEPDGTVSRTQLDVVDSVITVGRPSVHGQSPSGGVSSMLYVYVDDVDAHHTRARAAGATIVTGPGDMPWGDRRYQAADPEGHQWTFARYLGEPSGPCD
jgi:uncharacterized glyoxalase superfamily protein PhnB